MPENDIQTTNTQDNNCIQKGIEYHNDKQYCSKEMNSIAKDAHVKHVFQRKL